MTCQDFRHKWDELLDVEAGLLSSPLEDRPVRPLPRPASGVDDREALLLAHAAACPVCRPIAARYQVLRHAIRAWRCPPMPPADLANRILSTPNVLTPRTWEPAARRAPRLWRDHRSHVALLSGLAATVIACMLLGLTLQRVRSNHHNDGERPATQVTVGDLKSIADPETAPTNSTALNRALAEATSATWDLARSASEPAARISRDMLDATTQRDPGPNEVPTGSPSKVPTGRMEGLASLSVPIPSLDPGGADASTMLQQVGDHLSAGVQPLSSTARHAFGFLLGPPRDRNEPVPTGPTSSGA